MHAQVSKILFPETRQSAGYTAAERSRLLGHAHSELLLEYGPWTC